MEKLKNCQWLLLAFVGLLSLLYADVLTYPKFRISILTIVFGFIPVLIQIFRTARKLRSNT